MHQAVSKTTSTKQTIEVQRSSEIAIDAKAAAKEATQITKIGKATMKTIRGMKLASQQS